MRRFIVPIASPLCLVALSACDGRAGNDYHGSSLLTITGSVRLESNDAPKPLAPALVFGNHRTGTDVAIVDVDVKGEFPARFTFDVFEPPPEETFQSNHGAFASEPPFAFGHIGAIATDHASSIPLSVGQRMAGTCDATTRSGGGDAGPRDAAATPAPGVDRDAGAVTDAGRPGDAVTPADAGIERPCQFTTLWCRNSGCKPAGACNGSKCYPVGQCEGAECVPVSLCDRSSCYSETRYCDATLSSCGPPAMNGDPALKNEIWEPLAGLSNNYVVIYLTAEADESTYLSFAWGAGRRLSAGYHLLRVDPMSPSEAAQAQACALAANQRAFGEYDARHGTNYESFRDVPDGDEAASKEIHRALLEYAREARCAPSPLVKLTPIEPADRAPIEIEVGTEPNPALSLF